MTQDLSYEYGTTGREGRSTGRTLNGPKKIIKSLVCCPDDTFSVLPGSLFRLACIAKSPSVMKNASPVVDE